MRVPYKQTNKPHGMRHVSVRSPFNRAFLFSLLQARKMSQQSRMGVALSVWSLDSTDHGAGNVESEWTVTLRYELLR